MDDYAPSNREYRAVTGIYRALDTRRVRPRPSVRRIAAQITRRNERRRHRRFRFPCR